MCPLRASRTEENRNKAKKAAKNKMLMAFAVFQLSRCREADALITDFPGLLFLPAASQSKTR